MVVGAPATAAGPSQAAAVAQLLTDIGWVRTGQPTLLLSAYARNFVLHDDFLPASVLPQLLPAGLYSLYIANGLAGPGLAPLPPPNSGLGVGFSLLQANLAVTADPSDSWPAAVFTVGSTAGCGTIPACIATCGRAGGGTVAVGPGSTYFTGGEALVFPEGVPVALRGAGKDATFIVWPLGSSLPANAPANVYGEGASAQWRIEGLTIGVQTGAVGGPQPPGLALPAVLVHNGSTGVRLDGVRITVDLTKAPEFAAGNPIRITDAGAVSLHGVESTLLGNCAAHWPANTALSVHNASDVSIIGSVFTSSCQGWCVSSSLRTVIADCAFNSVGDVSQGSSFGTDGGAPGVAEHFYWVRCWHAPTPIYVCSLAALQFSSPSPISRTNQPHAGQQHGYREPHCSHAMGIHDF